IEIQTRQHKISGATAIVGTGTAARAGPMDLINWAIAYLPLLHDQAAAVAVHCGGIHYAHLMADTHHGEWLRQFVSQTHHWIKDKDVAYGGAEAIRGPCDCHRRGQPHQDHRD